jgi:hypothetical protein
MVETKLGFALFQTNIDQNANMTPDLVQRSAFPFLARWFHHPRLTSQLSNRAKGAAISAGFCAVDRWMARQG